MAGVESAAIIREMQLVRKSLMHEFHIYFHESLGEYSTPEESAPAVPLGFQSTRLSSWRSRRDNNGSWTPEIGEGSSRLDV